MSAGLVTFGEALASFRTSSGKLRHATTVDVGIAGAEATVAVGVSRLGAPATWMGRIGADEPGALVLTRLREEGVDTSAAITDRQAPTGTLLELLAHADIVFARTDEARLLGFDGDAEALTTELAKLGPDEVIVTQGPRGAVAEISGARYDVPAYPVHEIDADGTDEAFIAGYLADLLAGAPADRRVRTAAACRAAAMSVPGAADSLPERTDLIDLPRQHRLTRTPAS
ncbi:hypothetical protein ACZ91_18100 [Streptomyces regensis]|nr:hypothetical protein ACZ91_18100 [Streptomyces regensis]